MPLNVRFDINGDDIGQLTITRQETSGDQARYRYEYRGAKGSSTGSVWHRPAEGAMTLAAKVVEKIDFPNWKLT